MRLTFPDGTTVGPDELYDLVIGAGVFFLVYCILRLLLG